MGNETRRLYAGRVLPLLALSVMLCISASGRCLAGEGNGIAAEVVVGKSMLLTVQTNIKTISVADPAVADVVVISPKEVQVNGKKLGTTSVIVWDTAGKKTFFDITVTVDLGELRGRIAEIAPGDDVKLRMINEDTLVVTGSVSSDERRIKIRNLLLGFGHDITETELYILQGGITKEVRSAGGGGEGFKFVMLLEVTNTPQVMLQITVASIDRKAVNDLGINWAYASDQAVGLFSGAGGITAGAATISSALGITASGGTAPVTPTGGPQFGVLDLRNNTAYFLKALNSKGLAKILAEPNLIVKSGATGKFTAGGEFPYPVVQSVGAGALPTITVEFKPFGIIMDFEPTVKETGLIMLKLVNAEVSTLDFNSVVTIGGVTVPLVRKDNVSTSVDLKDGESFVIAGLMQEDWSKKLDKIPILGDIPILGAFFRDQHMQKEERELVFLVTPKIVRPMAAGAKAELPGAAEPNAVQDEYLKWFPGMPTKDSIDPELVK